MAYIPLFVYLQILDFLTTLVGLQLGLSEGSPFVRGLMYFGPVAALLISKFCALAIAGLCAALNRHSAIRRINYWYAGLVLWNLSVILLAPRWFL